MHLKQTGREREGKREGGRGKRQVTPQGEGRRRLGNDGSAILLNVGADQIADQGWVLNKGAESSRRVHANATLPFTRLRAH